MMIRTPADPATRHNVFEVYVVEPLDKPGIVAALEVISIFDDRKTVVFRALRTHKVRHVQLCHPKSTQSFRSSLVEISSSVCRCFCHCSIICMQDYQRQGLAKLLKSHLERRTLQIQGVQRLRLTTTSGNTASLHLYKGMKI